MAFEKFPHPERDPGLDPGEQSKDATRKSSSITDTFTHS
jgi:hypothetical protein